jgi:hypothetical protein
VKVSSSSIQSISVLTGGAGAEFGGGSSGVINTKIREASDRLEISGGLTRDYLRTPRWASSFFTDIAEVSVGFPVPGTKKKLTLYNDATLNLSDDYFPNVANQLKSSLFPSNMERWAPRQSNSWTHTAKMAWKIKSGTKLTLTNQHSLNINQNTRTLQIVGFDAILAPGYQYNRSNNLDNATTYTHHSNLTALNLNHLINVRWGLNASVGRLFTNLRADANGRPFRAPTVDEILDEDNIVTGPVSVFNPNDPSGILYVRPGDGLVNNNGISSVWHDHYAEEWTALEQQRQQMAALQSQAQALQKRTPLSREEALKSLQALTRSAMPSAQVAAQNERVSVSFKAASATVLASWLQSARENAQVRVVDAQWQRTPEGLWEGAMVLKLPSRNGQP